MGTGLGEQVYVYIRPERHHTRIEKMMPPRTHVLRLMERTLDRDDQGYSVKI